MSVGVTTPPSISNVALASRYVSGGNSNEYYICGNQDETVSVSVAYSGDFSSFKIDLVGQLNDGNNGTTRAFLPYGPFTLDTSVNGEGDTLSVVTRRLLIK